MMTMGGRSKEAASSEKSSKRHFDNLSFVLQPPVIHAILNNNYDDVKRILEEDSDAASARDSEKRSPLHIAAFVGFADNAEVKFLIMDNIEAFFSLVTVNCDLNWKGNALKSLWLIFKKPH